MAKETNDRLNRVEQRVTAQEGRVWSTPTPTPTPTPAPAPTPPAPAPPAPSVQPPVYMSSMGPVASQRAPPAPDSEAPPAPADPLVDAHTPASTTNPFDAGAAQSLGSSFGVGFGAGAGVPESKRSEQAPKPKFEKGGGMVMLSDEPIIPPSPPYTGHDSAGVPIGTRHQQLDDV